MKFFNRVILLLFVSFNYACSSINYSDKSDFDLEIEKYIKLKAKKSFAVAIEPSGKWAFGVAFGYPIQEMADTIALRNCEIYKKELKIEEECYVYMQGNKTL